MSPTLTTFLFELVNFLLLAGLLGWLLFKPVRAMLQARQAADTRHADDLAARTAEADRRRTDLEQQKAAFDAEMASVRTARLAAADRDAAAILARAREAAGRERERAIKMMAHLERTEFERLASAVAAASRDAVERLLTSLGSPDMEAGLVRAACRQLQALDATSLGAVSVESATPLAERDRDALIAAAGPRAVSSTFRVVPDLGAGVRVTTARGLIDASAQGVAAEAERLLARALLGDTPTTTP